MDLFLQVFVIILQYQQNTLKPYTLAHIHSLSPVYRSLKYRFVSSAEQISYLWLTERRLSVAPAMQDRVREWLVNK
jgi:hypothetical protein